MSWTHRDIDQSLHQHDGLAACLEESPWIVYGWLVYDPTHPTLKFVYVKDGVRRCGIAMWLLFSAFGGRVFNAEAHTKAGDALVRKYDGYRYSGEAESLREAYASPRERVGVSQAG
jgi:hypothetical protein